MERGRPINFTPDELLEVFNNYKVDTKANPRTRTIFVGKDAEPRLEKLERPLTLEGFYNYCYDIKGVVRQYFTNQGELYEDYISVCTYIRNIVRQDQIEGGMVGQYNPSITQRLNNLVERQDVTTTTEVKVLNIDPLADDIETIEHKEIKGLE
jgi:hypothetical protein